MILLIPGWEVGTAAISDDCDILCLLIWQEVFYFLDLITLIAFRFSNSMTTVSIVRPGLQRELFQDGWTPFTNLLLTVAVKGLPSRSSQRK